MFGRSSAPPNSSSPLAKQERTKDVGHGARLTFYQRHFCRSTTRDPEDARKPENRKFSILSLGFLCCAALLCIIIIVILVPVLVTVLRKNKNNQQQPQQGQQGPSPINLAIDENFPDPSLVLHNGTWFAFGTNDAAGILKQNQQHNDSGVIADVGNIQLATSTDFMNWTLLDTSHDPLPEVGMWANRDLTAKGPRVPKANVWAPAILKRPSDGKYVLFYSATHTNASFTHCVGAALSRSNSPAGPFDPFNQTIACPLDQGGAIDPATFIDKDGTVYVAWKVDGNSDGHGGECGNTAPPIKNTPIQLQKMQADGVTPIGNFTTILDRTDADGPLVEAPALLRSHEGIYFLFFSSGCTRTPSYNLKYATASNVTGPYTRAAQPLLSTGDFGLQAPGSVGIGEMDDGTFEMAFHARVNTDIGGVRAMFTTKIQFNGTIAILEPQNFTAPPQ